MVGEQLRAVARGLPPAPRADSSRPGEKSRLSERRLEAFAVDDGGAGLVVLLLGDPHLLEGGQLARMEPPIHTEYLVLRWGDDL